MRYLVIISSLLMLLAGCTSGNKNVEKEAFDNFRAEIRTVISDPDRQAKALEIVDKLIEELQSLHAKKVERLAQSRKLNANYDTTMAEYQAFIHEQNVEYRHSQQRILDNRTAFIAITTPEEWDQLLSVRDNSITAAIKAVRVE
ncbi:MAG: hypothetical protein GY777_13525 [Candidatus Brocadiaceae bacterium]|nr:hypothetical protein [Candidatus Brocadiaceae bacterium]